MAKQLTQLEGRTLAGVTFDGETETWLFSFFGRVFLRVNAAWRVRTATNILCGWRDHGQKFGRDAPVDIAVEVRAAFEPATVVSAEASDGTGDLVIRFVNGAALEVFNDSSGYEGWQLDHAGGCTVGQGGGRVV